MPLNEYLYDRRGLYNVIGRSNFAMCNFVGIKYLINMMYVCDVVVVDIPPAAAATTSSKKRQLQLDLRRKINHLYGKLHYSTESEILVATFLITILAILILKIFI